VKDLAPRLLLPSHADLADSGSAGADVPRDRHDRPLIHVPGRDKPVPYTRCTTFVDCIEDKTALATWGKRMVLVGAARDARITARAGLLDPDIPGDKQTLNRLAATAASIAGADTKRERGTHLHALSEHLDRGEPLPATKLADVADLGAYLTATLHLDVLEIERLVVVDGLTVAGTPDRICHYEGPGPDGEPFAGNLIVDLKTGSVDRGALKMAMQLAVYSRGRFYDHRTRTRSPLPDVDQRWGLIIHLPAGTAQCTVYWIDLTAGWNAALTAERVRELRRIRTGTLLRPFHPPV